MTTSSRIKLEPITVSVRGKTREVGAFYEEPDGRRLLVKPDVRPDHFIIVQQGWATSEAHVQRAIELGVDMVEFYVSPKEGGAGKKLTSSFADWLVNGQLYRAKGYEQQRVLPAKYWRDEPMFVRPAKAR